MLTYAYAWKVGVMELGRPQTASFTGQQWIYYSGMLTYADGCGC